MPSIRLSMFLVALSSLALGCGERECGTEFVPDPATGLCVCPEGRIESRGMCLVPDGGVEPDGGLHDGGGPDAAEGDAGGDSVRVRVVHASFRVPQILVRVAGREIGPIVYGSVSAPIVVPRSIGGDTEVVVETGTGDALVSRTLALTESTTLVVAPETNESGETIYPLADDLPAAGGEPVYRVLNAMSAHAPVLVGNLFLTDSPFLSEMALGESSELLTTSDGLVQTAIVDIPDEGDGDILAAFSTQLARSAWIVLFGDTGAHLGAPRAMSALAIDADGGRLLTPDTMLYLLNATSDDVSVYVCETQGGAGTQASALVAGSLRQIVVPTHLAAAVGLRVGPDESTACTDSELPSTDLDGHPRRARTLVVVTGPSASPTLRVVPERAHTTDPAPGDALLVFSHFAAATYPSASLSLADADAAPPTPFFAGASLNVPAYAVVPRGTLQGRVQVRHPSMGSPLTSGALDATDVTDVVHVVYSDSTAGAPAHVVSGPQGRTWRAEVLRP